MNRKEQWDYLMTNTKEQLHVEEEIKGMQERLRTLKYLHARVTKDYGIKDSY
jgi:hypothetical protein